MSKQKADGSLTILIKPEPAKKVVELAKAEGTDPRDWASFVIQKAINQKWDFAKDQPRKRR